MALLEACVGLIWIAMAHVGRRPACVVVEPGKESANAASCRRHAGVAGPVVEIDGISVGPNGLPARKDDLGDISVPLVYGLGAEDPAVSALQAHIRLVEVEQSETETVNAAAAVWRTP